MNIAIAAFALLIMSLSLWGLTDPKGLVALVLRTAAGKGFLYIAVGSRVVLAALLWFAAVSARHPTVFKVLAIVALVAAIGILLAGKERSLKLMQWVAKKPTAFQRGGMLLGVGFGSYLLWAIWPSLALLA